jgi:DNA-binding PadR family transcriptional regulator
MALLGLLRQKRQSGYDLRRTFATTAMRHYSDSPGSIYPALRRLEKRGSIKPVSLPGWKDSRGRQDFALTGLGEVELIGWLKQRVSDEDVRFRLAELMLRFAFMDGSIPRWQTIRFLDEFTEGLQRHVGVLREKAIEMGGKTPSLHTGLLAFEAGIRGMETQLAWAREVRARLGETLQ